ncbi:MAG: transcriptional repressor [Schleiferiaceae bacterium]|nr:transcriptional repressor [Schleiferiaceae bacterium]
MTSEETLKQFNLRKTKIRVAVLDSLSQSTVAQSYSTMQNALHEFDRTTLYRTLLTLTEYGLIHKAYEENGESFYARCFGCTGIDHKHEHLHLKCSKCGGVECVEISEVLKANLAQLPFEEVNIYAKGPCASCAA